MALGDVDDDHPRPHRPGALADRRRPQQDGEGAVGGVYGVELLQAGIVVFERPAEVPYGPVPFLGDDEEKERRLLLRCFNFEPLAGGAVAVLHIAAEIGFEHHFRQQVDEVVEAALALHEIAGALGHLVFEDAPVEEQREDEQRGQQCQEQRGEDVEQGEDDPHVLPPVEGADELAVVGDRFFQVAQADEPNSVQDSREGRQRRAGDMQEVVFAGNGDAEELVAIGCGGQRQVGPRPVAIEGPGVVGDDGGVELEVVEAARPVLVNVGPGGEHANHHDDQRDIEKSALGAENLRHVGGWRLFIKVAKPGRSHYKKKQASAPSVCGSRLKPCGDVKAVSPAVGKKGRYPLSCCDGSWKTR